VFAPIQHFAPFVKLYRERLQEAGHDLSQVSISTGNHCFVGTSSAQAKDVWAKHYLRYLHFVSTLVETKDYEQAKQFKAFAGVKSFLESISTSTAPVRRLRFVATQRNVSTAWRKQTKQSAIPITGSTPTLVDYHEKKYGLRCAGLLRK
jgi:hypothetical protein